MPLRSAFGSSAMRSLLAGGEVERDERRRVAPAAVHQVENLAALVETGRVRREAIGHADIQERLPRAVGARLQQLPPAVGRHLRGKADTILVVGDESSKSGILLDQQPLAREQSRVGRYRVVSDHDHSVR